MTSGTRRFRGKKLRQLRTARALSQSQLAAKVGAHVTSISDWERGDNAPRGHYVVSLAETLGVTADAFYGDDDEESSLQPLSRDEYAIFGEMMARIVAHQSRERV